MRREIGGERGRDMHPAMITLTILATGLVLTTPWVLTAAAQTTDPADERSATIQPLGAHAASSDVAPSPSNTGASLALAHCAYPFLTPQVDAPANPLLPDHVGGWCVDTTDWPEDGHVHIQAQPLPQVQTTTITPPPGVDQTPPLVAGYDVDDDGCIGCTPQDEVWRGTGSLSVPIEHDPGTLVVFPQTAQVTVPTTVLTLAHAAPIVDVTLHAYDDGDGPCQPSDEDSGTCGEPVLALDTNEHRCIPTCKANPSLEEPCDVSTNAPDKTGIECFQEPPKETGCTQALWGVHTEYATVGGDHGCNVQAWVNATSLLEATGEPQDACTTYADAPGKTGVDCFESPPPGLVCTQALWGVHTKYATVGGSHGCNVQAWVDASAAS